jgi:hypothetical protein
MDDITSSAMFVVISLMTLVAAFLLIKWAVDDARARGKSPILVAAAVILFFPWGWIAWLLFRPENYVNGGRKPFRLDDHRVQ